VEEAVRHARQQMAEIIAQMMADDDNYVSIDLIEPKEDTNGQ
jgi:hypothetical protein